MGTRESRRNGRSNSSYIRSMILNSLPLHTQEFKRSRKRRRYKQKNERGKKSIE